MPAEISQSRKFFFTALVKLCVDQSDNKASPDFADAFEMALHNNFIPSELPAKYNSSGELWYEKNSKNPRFTATDLLTAGVLKLVTEEPPPNLDIMLAMRDELVETISPYLPNIDPLKVDYFVTTAFYQSTPLRTLNTWFAQQDPDEKDFMAVATSVITRVTSIDVNYLPVDKTKKDQEILMGYFLKSLAIIVSGSEKKLENPELDVFFSLRYLGEAIDEQRTKLSVIGEEAVKEPEPTTTVRMQFNDTVAGVAGNVQGQQVIIMEDGTTITNNFGTGATIGNFANVVRGNTQQHSEGFTQHGGDVVAGDIIDGDKVGGKDYTQQNGQQNVDVTIQQNGKTIRIIRKHNP
ncbi:MAG: hypothetical protein ACOYK8_05200 [Alphaproteobacteria bacterium]